MKNIQDDNKTNLDIRNITMGDSSNESHKQNRVAIIEDTENNSQQPMVCQKRGYTQRLKNTMVKEKIGRYAEKYKGRTATHPNQLAAEANKTLIERRLKRKHPTDLTKEIN